jgi:hypothetical protein
VCIGNNAMMDLKNIKNESRGISKQQQKTSCFVNDVYASNPISSKDVKVKILEEKNVRRNRRRSLFDLAFKNENLNYEDCGGEMYQKNNQDVLPEEKSPQRHCYFQKKPEERSKTSKLDDSGKTKACSIMSTVIRDEGEYFDNRTNLVSLENTLPAQTCPLKINHDFQKCEESSEHLEPDNLDMPINLNVQHCQKICVVCNFSATTARNLKIHMRNHAEKICRICKHLCKNAEDRRYHMSTAHKNKPSRRAQGLQSGHACKDCTFVSTYIQDLIKHVQITHPAIKDKYCEQCNYATNKMAELNKHISMVHKKVKPKICDECSYFAFDTWKVKRHKNQMHKTKPEGSTI